MNNDKIINQFFGFRCKSAQVLSAEPNSGDSARPALDQSVEDATTGGMVVLLMGDALAARLADTVAAFGGSATLSRIAFKAYDNWKHQHNEITDIAAEVDFRNYGLRQSGIEPPDFELSMIKTMMRAANLVGRLHTDMQRTIFAGGGSRIPVGGDKALVREFVNHDSLIDEIVSRDLSLELKIELYLATYLVAVVNDLSETSFLKRLAKDLQIPDAIISQLQFQLPQSLPQAA